MTFGLCRGCQEHGEVNGDGFCAGCASRRAFPIPKPASQPTQLATVRAALHEAQRKYRERERAERERAERERAELLRRLGAHDVNLRERGG